MPEPLRPRVLALIPARGGSRGLPGKNLADLGGLPLIAWSIRAALGAALVDDVVVSTDDPAIAEAALAHGARAPFLRPPEISGDAALIGDVTRHAVAELTRRGERPGAVAVLYPTSPFRAPGLVDLLTGKLLEGCAEVATYARVPEGQAWVLDPRGEANVLPPAAPGRHLLMGLGLFEGHALSYPGTGRHAHVVDDPASLLDIDTAEDLRVARAMLDRGLITPPWEAA